MKNGERNIYIWAVAGLYLIYLGVRQFMALFGGTASIPVLNAASGIIFLAVGGAVLWREWRAYRRGFQNGEAEEESEQEGADEV